MQLVGQNVEGGVVQQQVEGSPRSVSDGEGGVSPTSSPGSPTARGGGAEAGAGAGGREKPGRVLPCPRCQSMNTKFCYYNNYSVAQPRHFCRQCQRYWTAGGTLRNVPVGGGSRKKNRRAGEPYQQQQQQQQRAQAAAGPFGVHAPPQQQQQLQQNVGFQQMLAQDGSSLALNFPGFYNPGGYADPAAYAAYPPPEPLHAMYGTAPGYYEMAAPSENVKPELWMMPPPPPPQPQQINGLNRWDQAKHGSSPPSTIEEEGSTPANGFSARGYEDGDAVSSMWHSLHDSDAMFQESMFQLSNPEEQQR